MYASVTWYFTLIFALKYLFKKGIIAVKNTAMNINVLIIKYFNEIEGFYNY